MLCCGGSKAWGRYLKRPLSKHCYPAADLHYKFLLCSFKCLLTCESCFSGSSGTACKSSLNGIIIWIAFSGLDFIVQHMACPSHLKGTTILFSNYSVLRSAVSKLICYRNRNYTICLYFSVCNYSLKPSFIWWTIPFLPQIMNVMFRCFALVSAWITYPP